jgi:hypothetical protein
MRVLAASKSIGNSKARKPPLLLIRVSPASMNAVASVPRGPNGGFVIMPPKLVGHRDGSPEARKSNTSF